MSARTCVCLDFETNGFPPKTKGEDWPRPFHSYPIQLSVDVVEDGAVLHHWDTLICGATRLCTWVQHNVPLTLTEISREGIPLGGRGVVPGFAVEGGGHNCNSQRRCCHYHGDATLYDDAAIQQQSACPKCLWQNYTCTTLLYDEICLCKERVRQMAYATRVVRPL